MNLTGSMCARDIARRRLETALALLRGVGVEAEGEVGDERPTYAIQDVLADRAFDEIIVSTLPPSASRWLKRDLPHRIAVEFGLPVTHLIGTAQPLPRRARPATEYLAEMHAEDHPRPVQSLHRPHRYQGEA
jgi:hypothetical protein